MGADGVTPTGYLRTLQLKEIEVYGTIAEASQPNMIPIAANGAGSGTTCGGITTVVSPTGCLNDANTDCTTATPDSDNLVLGVLRMLGCDSTFQRS